MPGAHLPRITECRDCQQPIRFVSMESGRNMPVNPAPRGAFPRIGHVAARLNGHRLEGFVVTRERQPGPAHRHYFTPHYSTCAKGKKPTTPTTEPDPALF